MSIDYKVGQQLWFVPTSSFRFAGVAFVEKVGRKWVHLSNNERVEVGQTRVDGGRYGSLGTVYVSKEAWEAEIQLNVSWRRFTADVQRCSRPADLTLADIVHLRALSGLPQENL